MDVRPIYQDLKKIVSSEFVTNDPAELWCYTGNLLPQNPEFVVLPGNVEEVVRVINLAADFQLPIIPRGFATRSTPRHPDKFPTTNGGIILETSRLKTIRDIDDARRTITADAGVTMAEISNRLAPMGWRIIEGSMTPYCATVGALTGVGPGLCKYGRRENQILDIEVVLSSGQIIHTSAMGGNGFDLTRIFIDAQGLTCLGVITAVTYRMLALPESLNYLNFEFNTTEDTMKFLHVIDRAKITNLPSIFQVNVYPDAVFRLYANMPLVRNQNKDFQNLLDRYPPFPADVVGLILEGRDDLVALERKEILAIASRCGGSFIGPEPVRDYYVNHNWTGNTKCHEDTQGKTTSWSEPFFLCAIDQYERAKQCALEKAIECGFEIGERYWARGTLRDGHLGFTACVTFDDTSYDEREKVKMFVSSVHREAPTLGSYERDETSSQVCSDTLLGIKKLLDPHGIMYPGIMYLD